MPGRREDPVLRSSRREAVFVLLLWAAALVYTVGYCALHGYGDSAESLTFILGFPDWVFWGILAPWAVCFLVTFGFAGFFMKDEDLGAEREEEDPRE